MKTFKEFLTESLDKSKYTATYEKSQFGGYVAIAKNEKNRVVYSSGESFTTKEAATGLAQAYLDGYFQAGTTSERAALRNVKNYVERNRDKLIIKDDY